MASDYMMTRAHDFTAALSLALPQMQFQAYVRRGDAKEVTDLYFFGFITIEVLIGGYCFEAEQDFVPHLLTATQFFRKAWQGEPPRFYPFEVQALYETHRADGSVWHRVV